MTDIKPLLSIVEAATGPDRGFEIDLMVEFLPKHRKCLALGLDELFPYVESFADGRWSETECIPYTRSIDAAVALIERVLGDVRVHTSHSSSYSSAEIISGLGKRQQMSLAGAKRPDGELALCLVTALLRAKIAESEAS